MLVIQAQEGLAGVEDWQGNPKISKILLEYKPTSNLCGTINLLRAPKYIRKVRVKQAFRNAFHTIWAVFFFFLPRLMRQENEEEKKEKKLFKKINVKVE